MKTLSKSNFTVKQLTLTGLMTAVICVLGPLAFNIPFSPVPISLGTLGIYFVVSVLGMKPGTVSVIIYILLGLAGVPVFTNFTGGPGKLFGPTGGYIIGYLFLTPVCGYFSDKFRQKLLPQFCGMLLGTVVLYLFGTVWLGHQMQLSFPEALAVGVLPYIPLDLIKMAAASAAGIQLKKRLQKAGLLLTPNRHDRASQSVPTSHTS